MKKQLLYLLAAALMTASCAEKPTDGEAGYGSLEIACTTDGRLDTRSTPPAGESFALTLTGPDGYKGEWATVSQFNSEKILLKEGDYTALITYGNPEQEGDNKICYIGQQDLKILRRKTAQVSITAQIANSQAVVRATDAFLDYFHDATFTMTTGSGSIFTFLPAKGKVESPMSVKVGTTLSVEGSARRQSWNGTSEGIKTEFKEQRVELTLARTNHIFTFDAKDSGSATLTIYLGDDFTETIEFDFEMNDGAIEDTTK